jgi:hypothetical protein
MRKVIVFGFALLCVTALSFLRVTPLERKSLNPDGTTTLAAPTKASQVEVTNFPAVQAVSGTVSVGNLPLDPEGNLRVTDSAAKYKIIKVADHLVIPPESGTVNFPPIEVAGWKQMSVIINISEGLAVVVGFNYGIEGMFGPGGGFYAQGLSIRQSDVIAPEVLITLTPQGGSPTVDLWLYLTE